MGNSYLYLVLKVCYLSLSKVLCFSPGYSKSITKCVVHEENFKLSYLVLSMQKFGVYSNKKLKNPVMCEDSKASSCQRDNQKIKQIIPSKTNYWFLKIVLWRNFRSHSFKNHFTSTNSFVIWIQILSTASCYDNI